VREATGAQEAILFGSRARGDHRDDSDVDILLIDEQPSEDALREPEATASRAQRETLPEAAGVELGWMTPAEFMEQRQMINSLAREIAKDGVPATPENIAKRRVQYVFDQEEDDGHIDWRDVQKQADDAMESARDLQLQVDPDSFVNTSDLNFGYIAQRALENAYKAVLGSHGIEYPVSGRDGHDLGRLVELIKECVGSPIPGGLLLPDKARRIRRGNSRATAAGQIRARTGDTDGGARRDSAETRTNGRRLLTAARSAFYDRTDRLVETSVLRVESCQHPASFPTSGPPGCPASSSATAPASGPSGSRPITRTSTVSPPISTLPTGPASR